MGVPRAVENKRRVGCYAYGELLCKMVLFRGGRDSFMDIVFPPCLGERYCVSFLLGGIFFLASVIFVFHISEVAAPHTFRYHYSLFLRLPNFHFWGERKTSLSG